MFFFLILINKQNSIANYNFISDRRHAVDFAVFHKATVRDVSKDMFKKDL